MEHSTSEQTTASCVSHRATSGRSMSSWQTWHGMTSPEGLPIGLQFAARHGGEAVLLALAYELEAARPWKDRLPRYSVARIAGR